MKRQPVAKWLFVLWVACGVGVRGDDAGHADTRGDFAREEDAPGEHEDAGDTTRVSPEPDATVATDKDDVTDGETLDPDGPPYSRHINPFIGTGGDLANVGSALPGATAPLGLVKASPDTTDKYGAPPTYQHCAGYWYPDSFMYGISHNHLHGTGAPDYGNILVTPTVGMSEDKTSKKRFFQPFTHEDEVAAPGYYAVTITDPAVRVEVTATTRCAHHRYRFLVPPSPTPAGALDAPAPGVIVLNAAASLLDGRSAGGGVAVDPAGRIASGWTHQIGPFSGRYGGFPVFFVARFHRDFNGFGTWLNSELREGQPEVQTFEDPASFGAWFEFDTTQDPVVEVQVCLSYTGVAGAMAALQSEMPGFDFEGTRAATEAAWEAEVSRFEVSGGSLDDKAVFYTSVYHVLQMPTIWSDVDGRYRGFDGEVHQADGWTYYTDMSFWDTFRTQHPLLTLMWPERQRDMMRSLAAMQREGGYVPKWPMGMGDSGSMIGQHGASVVADTWLKGVRDFDVDSLYASMKATANAPGPPGSYGNRDCFPWYTDPGLGYCPADRTSDAVSKTLEYAFNDFCLAELARSLGKAEDEALFRLRAKHYATLWDPDSGFFRPRNEDGTFVTPFVPDVWDNGTYFTEGSAWQWLWFVPHDQVGLRALMGGDEKFVSRLSEFFMLARDHFSFVLPTPWYFHGNEPDLHAPFLFIEAGRPDLTQVWARWVLDTNYRNAWNGLVGNDDAGTLAAWYVFVASGLYPWPCVPGYYVTAPRFDRVVWHLPAGDLVIEAPLASLGPVVVQEVRWNGAPLPGYWLPHDEVARGGLLEFDLVPAPQTP